MKIRRGEPAIAAGTGTGTDPSILFVTTRSVTTWILLAAVAGAAGWAGYRAWTARRTWQETERLAAALQLESTSQVADVGAGNGAFTRALASRIVTQGRVYATEIDEDLLEALQASATDAGLANVTVVRARTDSSALPAGCCHAAFLRGVYHHVARPAETSHGLP